MKKDLVQIIKDNPGCIATIDNDGWILNREERPSEYDDWNGDKQDRWDRDNRLACDGEVKEIGDGYGSGNCYGGDILQALAVIVGIKVESV